MSSELRHDPLTDRWVVISAARAGRPHEIVVQKQSKPVANCPFCKGSENKTPPEIFAVLPDGSVRKDFRGENYGNWLIRAVPNKFPFLGLDSNSNGKRLGRHANGLYDRMDGYGAHEVIIECGGPEHEEIADCESGSEYRVERLFWLFKERMWDLARNVNIKSFLLFKNYKAEAGASLSHPHCQLNGMPIVAEEMAKELRLSMAHYELKSRCLLCDVLEQELESAKRIVLESANLVVFCPYASRFPGEMMIAPKPDSHSHQFHIISDDLIKELASVYIKVLKKLRNWFDDPPYNWVLHSAPVGFYTKNQGATIAEDTHWHFHILPRWTKIAGFEVGGGFYINPLPPEEAAQGLREVSLT
jgi:UDPglucose--hexose-1-phosphate uridylyltransferase